MADHFASVLEMVQKTSSRGFVRRFQKALGKKWRNEQQIEENAETLAKLEQLRRDVEAGIYGPRPGWMDDLDAQGNEKQDG